MCINLINNMTSLLLCVMMIVKIPIWSRKNSIDNFIVKID